MRQIGSQQRETLREAELTLHSRPAPREVILQDSDGKLELWACNDRGSGYVVQVGRWGYEFCRSLTGADHGA